jgi:hypothetical protein
MYHYTYYSYEEWGRGYIGKGSCDCNPEEELTYFGSYRDKTFKPTQKIILGVYNNSTEAIAAEIKLQHFFKVVPNPHFANQAYQTSTGFQTNSEIARKTNANMTPEQRREKTRKARSVKFQCTETGFISNAGSLTHYQKAKGIYTSKRVRLDQ